MGKRKRDEDNDCWMRLEYEENKKKRKITGGENYLTFDLEGDVTMTDSQTDL